MPADLTTLIQQFPEEPWFPGIARKLEREFWMRPQVRDRREAYGTARWLASDPSAPRDQEGTLSFALRRVAIIERLSGAAAERYQALDLKLGDAPLDPDGLALAQQGADLISLVPTLAESIGALVLAVHVIEAPGPAYDVSHSDPELPFSIFLSIPLGGANGAVRLSESLIHEAMHLQLTLLEQDCALIMDRDEMGYSPWMECDRPLGGLLHGLYVFTVISAFYERLQSNRSISDDIRQYSKRRRHTIASEVAELRHLPKAQGLTPAGQSLASYLLALSAPQPIAS